jgi:hypothetical protein
VVIAVMIMVVVIPITIRTPAMSVFIPPAMIGIPAVLARIVQLMAPLFSLLTLGAVMLDSFVQFVIGFRDASLAVVISAHLRRACKHEKASQCRGRNRCLSDERILQSISHELSSF